MFLFLFLFLDCSKRTGDSCPINIFFFLTNQICFFFNFQKQDLILLLIKKKQKQK